MTLFTLFVVLSCASVIRSETCFGPKETSLISTIRIPTGQSTSCPSGWKGYKNHCYHFSSNTNTWNGAEIRCRTMGGYLVQITDSSENAWFANMHTKSVQHHYGYWIGATKVHGGRWRWTHDSSNVKYFSWSRNQPDNAGGKENCAHFWRGMDKWNDAGCTTWGIGYICEKVQ
ncbi:perlucin-like protein [Mytilus californianus]|uniref:perlucin-like protein n=1 Tax=Mytilus californianus TaxID=6549 RepID=UPI0022477928|nr:perlucin-like protein [Mytilus californianus]